MAYTDFLTTTCTIHQGDEARGSGGAIAGDIFGAAVFTVTCSEPVPLSPYSGETLGRGGLILTHAIQIVGPRLGIGPGYQVRVGGRRFDVDSEIDSAGFGRVVRILCREVQA
jgi:hypothetical protein